MVERGLAWVGVVLGRSRGKSRKRKKHRVFTPVLINSDASFGHPVGNS